MGKIRKNKEPKKISSNITSDLSSNIIETEAKNNTSLNILRNKSNSLKKKTPEKQKILLGKNSTIQKTISKKQKIKQKHKGLLKKINLFEKQRKEDKKRIKREKTVITGDLNPLRDALPSLTELLKLSKNEAKLEAHQLEMANHSKNLSRHHKMKICNKQYVERLNCFKILTNDKNFKKNPRDAIAAHIQNIKNDLI